MLRDSRFNIKPQKANFIAGIPGLAEGRHRRTDYDSSEDSEGNKGYSGQTGPWELYNEIASDHDRRMLKEWEDTLSTLLIFAGLFSSILAAFIVGSMTNLQEDKLDAMKSILVTISRQIHNTTTSFYEPPTFKPLNWAVRVNCCLYTSLGCTVSSAMISVLALQWIRGYDMHLPAMADSRKRAIYRQFRFEGLQRWLLPQIISILPLLLHIALIIFFVALIDWLVHTNIVVASTMIFITAAIIVFYMTTQLAAAITPSAPFRTPVSHAIQRIGEVLVSIASSKASIHAASKSNGSSRENQAVTMDDLLPSSALIWLLNRDSHRQWPISNIIDILEHLKEHESASIAKQDFSRERKYWTTIFDRIFLDLFKQRRPDKTYSPEIERCFSVTLEASLIVGGGSLGPTSRSVLSSSPFIQFNFQSISLGLLCRFALWRSKAPFAKDSNDPPLDLYQKICSVCMKESPLLVLLCLEEIQSSLSARKMSRENALDCLNILLHTPDSSQGILNILSGPKTSALLLSIGWMTFGDSTPLPQSISAEETMIMILDRYHFQNQAHVTWSSSYISFIGGLLQQFLLKMATDQPNDLTLLQLEIFRHPSLLSIWMDKSSWCGLNLRSLLLPRFFRPTQGLYPQTDPSTPQWALELCHAVLLMTSLLPTPVIPFGRDWEIMTTALSTLAICITGPLVKKRKPLSLTIHDKGEWLVELIGGLRPAMDNSMMSFIISAMLSGQVRYRFDKNLWGRFEKDRLSALDSTDSVELRIAGNMLVGSECWARLPGPGDPAYFLPSFKVIIRNWRGFEPVVLLESDEDLAKSLCQMVGAEWENEVFEFLWTRTRQLKLPGNSSIQSQEESASLRHDMALVLRASLVVFTRKPHRAHEAFHILSWLSEYGPFAESFIDSNGIDWLYSLPFPISRQCDHCREIRSPNSALIKLFSRSQGFTSLDKSRVKLLLNSEVIYHGKYPENDAGNIILLTEHLLGRLKALGHEGVYPKAGEACEMILEQRIKTGRITLGEEEAWHGDITTGSPLTWASSLPTMINELKGSISSTSQKRQKTNMTLSFSPFTPRGVTADLIYTSLVQSRDMENEGEPVIASCNYMRESLVPVPPIVPSASLIKYAAIQAEVQSFGQSEPKEMHSTIARFVDIHSHSSKNLMSPASPDDSIRVFNGTTHIPISPIFEQPQDSFLPIISRQTPASSIVSLPAPSQEGDLSETGQDI